MNLFNPIRLLRVRLQFAARTPILPLSVFSLLLSACISASAQTVSTLYSFTGGADGNGPYARLIQDAQGNLYGTTVVGGAHGAGLVFKLDPSGNETVLYAFTGGSDGDNPFSGVIQDAQGNLYGTTMQGGDTSQYPFGYGVVFKLDPSGNESVLHSFTGGADGGMPKAGLIRDAQGNLYGATTSGGASGDGVVFKLDPSGNETVLHSFTGTGGSHPYAGVIQDAQGSLYGTSFRGGAGGIGVVFKLDPSGNETVLHSFTGGTDGSLLTAGLIEDAQGNLYGTTTFGGNPNIQAGVVFKISQIVLKSIKLHPTSVRGGKSATGTVTLTKPALLGGATVTLSSSDPTVASVPASVTVSSGQKSATFTVTTTAVSSTTTVTISATYGGVTKTVTLTVKK